MKIVAAFSFNLEVDINKLHWFSLLKKYSGHQSVKKVFFKKSFDWFWHSHNHRTNTSLRAIKKVKEAIAKLPEDEKGGFQTELKDQREKCGLPEREKAYEYSELDLSPYKIDVQLNQ
jgi:hypothetical protein